MKIIKSKKEQRVRRHSRIRSRVSGTGEMPRLSVFKSNKHISAQIIDDIKKVTLASAHSSKVAGKTLLEKSFAVGEQIAKSAKALKINAVVFDRGGFMYTGKVKQVAEGARQAGLKF